MAEPKFYESMPETLPGTLPMGTRSIRGSFATSELSLKSESTYPDKCDAYWGHWNGLERKTYNRVDAIDWKSVPLPAQSPAEPPCAACGARPAPYGFVMADLTTHQVCGECAGGGIGNMNAAIRSRNASKPTESDPNIFSHVCASCAEGDPRLGEQPCRQAGDGKWYCVDTCFDGAVERFSKPLCLTPACAARSVVATHGECCVYCDQSEHESTRRHMLDPTAESIAARARMDAADRRERPRVNRAERKMLTAGHPSTWPSNEGEE